MESLSEAGVRLGRDIEDRAKRLRVSLTKNRKRNGGQGSVAILKNSRQLGCVFKDIEPPKSNSIFTEGPDILGDQSAVCNSQKVH